jgi:hypothetical protein
MKRSDKKAFLIFIVVFVGFLILIHGNEIGLLHNTHKADEILVPILYVPCLISILLFFRVIELLKTLNIKEKILTTLIFLVLALFPMYLLLGVCKWVDYYTTDKHWRLVKATVIIQEKSYGGRGVTNYLYTVKTEDSIIRLSTTLRFPLEKVMYLKLCKTNLGMIIVDRYYDSIP